MPLDAKSFTITLNEAEAAELMNVSGGSAGQQQVQAQLKEQLADGNRTLTLADPQLGKLIRFMTQGPTAVQGVLKRVFKRPLVEMMSKP